MNDVTHRRDRGGPRRVRGAARSIERVRPESARGGSDRDRGAVSLEQVLWFVAAGVSVAVIAAILWNKIRDEANTPVQSPSAP